MSATAAVVKTFAVGRFTATLTTPSLARGQIGSAVIEWTPRMPDFEKEFSDAQRGEYRLKLIAAINEAAAAMRSPPNTN